MKSIPYIKRKLIKRILALFSFTTALFIFQACYGVPQDFYDSSIYIKCNIKSKTTNEPIEGINVRYRDEDLGTSDKNGEFTAFLYRTDTLEFKFEDIDGLEFGKFASKDTTFVPGWENDSLYFDVFLPEIEE